jgi:hypothetical protein
LVWEQVFQKHISTISCLRFTWRDLHGGLYGFMTSRLCKTKSIKRQIFSPSYAAMQCNATQCTSQPEWKASFATPMGHFINAIAPPLPVNWFWCPLVTDRNRNSHFRPKPNIRQLKTTKYSVSAEYTALLFTFGQKSMIYYIHAAKFVKFGQHLTMVSLFPDLSIFT